MHAEGIEVEAVRIDSGELGSEASRVRRIPCRKHSLWKETWPGPRQVYRQYDPHGRIGTDVLACAGEAMEGRALLHEVMVDGKRSAPSPSLDQLRRYCREEIATLPPGFRSLDKGPRSPVKVSARQHALAAEVDRVQR